MTDRHSNHREQEPQESFAGFEHLTANFVYCPNQFFDVCLASRSRGVVRIVGYLLRRTLGWLDKQGNPIEQEIEVPYSQFVAEAGVSRGAIRQAIDDAIGAGFITRTQPGHAKASGKQARTARYSLRWDRGGVYTRDAESFQGFFADQGHRSPIPNSFFDWILPREKLAVLKVVGTVLRHGCNSTVRIFPIPKKRSLSKPSLLTYRPNSHPCLSTPPLPRSPTHPAEASSAGDSIGKANVASEPVSGGSAVGTCPCWKHGNPLSWIVVLSDERSPTHQEETPLATLQPPHAFCGDAHNWLWICVGGLATG